MSLPVGILARSDVLYIYIRFHRLSHPREAETLIQLDKGGLQNFLIRLAHLVQGLYDIDPAHCGGENTNYAWQVMSHSLAPHQMED